MKFMISMNDELASKVEEMSKSNYMSRSGFISMCVTKYIQENSMIEQLPDMLKLMKKAALDNKE